ncbi:unnamed protein product [Caenorhabditis auriculariae]|uniref:RRM domain-containing protein n=1 Tax=Caenorhabditis auriculariae TaxID=2777116 RepID=A0A8S1H4M7_9PELO|nr:unnamed protein product [Caenorhabditis auriculariae]
MVRARTCANRLYVGKLPRRMSQRQVQELLNRACTPLRIEVEILMADNQERNRGYAFVQFQSEQEAEAGQRMLGSTEAFGNRLFIGPALRELEPSEELMRQSCSLHIRGVFSETTTTVELTEHFGGVEAGIASCILGRNYAFINCTERAKAEELVAKFSGTDYKNVPLNIRFSRPRISYHKAFTSEEENTVPLAHFMAGTASPAPLALPAPVALPAFAAPPAPVALPAFPPLAATPAPPAQPAPPAPQPPLIFPQPFNLPPHAPQLPIAPMPHPFHPLNAQQLQLLGLNPDVYMHYYNQMFTTFWQAQLHQEPITPKKALEILCANDRLPEPTYKTHFDVVSKLYSTEINIGLIRIQGPPQNSGQSAQFSAIAQALQLPFGRPPFHF